MPSKATQSPERRKYLEAQGAAIAAARRRLGLTQAEAARVLGVPLWTYRSWEYSTRQPKVEIRKWLVKDWKIPSEILALSAAGCCPACGRNY